jgi:hypothetical protein
MEPQNLLMHVSFVQAHNIANSSAISSLGACFRLHNNYTFKQHHQHKFVVHYATHYNAHNFVHSRDRKRLVFDIQLHHI